MYLISNQSLKEAYIGLPIPLDQISNRFFQYSNLVIGVVSCKDPEIAAVLSKVLCDSLEKASNSKGGHLPPEVVLAIQKSVISTEGIQHLWSLSGYRYVLTRKHSDQYSELIASILIGKTTDTLFFFSSKYNNLSQSDLNKTINLELADPLDSSKKWFDRFVFPSLDEFKPKEYHQIANFVVSVNNRKHGFSRLFIECIKHLNSKNNFSSLSNEDSQYYRILNGKGLWQLADPPWLQVMTALGFYLRGGAESFFVEQPWSNLPPIFQGNKRVTNIVYNKQFGLPNLYDTWRNSAHEIHLEDRIPQVCEWSRNEKYKLQYYQLMCDFYEKLPFC